MENRTKSLPVPASCFKIISYHRYGSHYWTETHWPDTGLTFDVPVFPAVAALVLLAVLLVAGQVAGVESPDPRLSADVPKEMREFYRNPDGSCVQCSIGMAGIDQNIAAASTLLWDSSYGPKERGGSGPERVAEYAKKRGIKVYNVTGRPVYEYLAWACANGRGAALTCGAYHMQYLMGHDTRSGTWYVCNNNSPQKVDAYDDATLHRLCDASGPWCVVLDAPPHPARGVYRQWWKSFSTPEMTSTAAAAGQARPAVQLVQFQPRELPQPTFSPEVNAREVRRRGDMEQVVGDPVTSHPVLDRFGEVMALPRNDADKWHIWCLLDPTGQRSKRLISAWATSPDLRAFAVPGDPGSSWAHFASYLTDDGSQSWRWEKLQTQATPCVFVQPPISRKYGDPSTIVFQAVYMDNPAELAVAIREAILNYLATVPPAITPAIAQPDRGDCGPNCPPFRPAPKPQPNNPDGDERNPFSPLIPPTPTIKPWSFPWLHCLAFCLGMFALVAGLVVAVVVAVIAWRVVKWVRGRPAVTASPPSPVVTPQPPPTSTP